MTAPKIFLQLLAPSLIVLLSLQTSIAQTKNDRKMYGLKGAVETVELGWLEKTKNGNKKQIGSVKRYNQEGNESETLTYGGSPSVGRQPYSKAVSSISGSILSVRYYEVQMDNKNKLVGVPSGTNPIPTPPKEEAAGSTLSQAIIKFDSQNNIYEETWYKRLVNKGPIEYRNVFQLNQEGTITEEQIFEAGKTLTAKIQHKYNVQNIEEEYVELSAKGVVESKNTYSGYRVDAAGNWIERQKVSEYVNGNGKLIKDTITEYRKITYFPSAK
jgi:hypothetical protein